MKKGIVISLAIALMVLFLGCDQPSTPTNDPNTPQPPTTDTLIGNWFYLEVDTSACTEDTFTMIFNGPTGTKQSKDITDVPKSGTVKYDWYSTTGAHEVSTRTDCPDKSIGNKTDKLGVYVYTDASSVNCYGFNASQNWWVGTIEANNWPGIAMNTDAEIVVEEVTVNFVVTITGASEGDKFYMDGDVWTWSNGWPIATWSGNSTEKAQACITAKKNFSTVADDSGTCTITTSFKCPKGVAASGKIQIINYVDPEDDSGLWGDPTISKNITPEWPTLSEDGNFTLTVDVSE